MKVLSRNLSLPNGRTIMRESHLYAARSSRDESPKPVVLTEGRNYQENFTLGLDGQNPMAIVRDLTPARKKKNNSVGKMQELREAARRSLQAKIVRDSLNERLANQKADAKLRWLSDQVAARGGEPSQGRSKHVS